jgi:hypothetical protein
MVSHESVVNTLDFEIALRRKCNIGRDDPCIQVMSVFADMSGAFDPQACAYAVLLSADRLC